MIHIDGSYMEGGGQIVRTALALSALTGKPFRVDRIRQNRPKPGLKHQHVSCIGALKQLAHAEAEGAQAGSMALEFTPGRISGQSHSAPAKPICGRTPAVASPTGRSATARTPRIVPATAPSRARIVKRRTKARAI